jgi:hypothetical protein
VKSTTPTLSVVEALEAVIRSKDEFIVYLQDEVNELKAQANKEPAPRVKQPTEFKSNRGYKPLHIRIRENVLAAKAKTITIDEAEEKYEKVVVD